MKRVYVVCDELANPNDAVWTLSEDPNKTGWETDSGYNGYGLTKEQAEFYARCINEKLGEVAK